MTPLNWQVRDDRGDDQRTLIIDADNPLGPAEQLEAAGFNPAPPSIGIALSEDNDLIFSGGEPPLAPTHKAMAGLEQVFLYDQGFVVTLKLTGSYKLFRLL